MSCGHLFLWTCISVTPAARLGGSRVIPHHTQSVGLERTIIWWLGDILQTLSTSVNYLDLKSTSVNYLDQNL